MQTASLVIEFIPGSKIQAPSEPLHACISMDVVFSDGQQVSIPADQVVFFDDSQGSARIGLGGMSFEGLENRKLVFWRVRDLLPEELLSPQRELRLLLTSDSVQSVHVSGNRVWPGRQSEAAVH